MTAAPIFLLESIAAAIRRSQAWCASLLDRGMVADLGGALPQSVVLAAGGDYCVWWDGDADAVSLSLTGIGNLVGPFEREPGRSWAVVTDASATDRLDVATASASPDISLVSATEASATVVEIHGARTAAPTCIIGLPRPSIDLISQDALETTTSIDCFLVGNGEPNASADLVHRKYEAAIAWRIIEDLAEQAMEGLFWGLVGGDLVDSFRQDPSKKIGGDFMTWFTLNMETGT